jgi:hypothetical protein
LEKAAPAQVEQQQAEKIAQTAAAECPLPDRSAGSGG